MQKDRNNRSDPDVARTRDQQHTGNHDYPGQEQGGPEEFGGTRAGSENVEHTKPEQRARPDKRPGSKQQGQK